MLSVEVDLEGADHLYRSIHDYLQCLQVGLKNILNMNRMLEETILIKSRYCLSIEQQMEFEKLIRWCRQQSTGEYWNCLVWWCWSLSRSSHHISPGFLRVSGGEEVVGTVEQATLAWHHCYLSQRCSSLVPIKTKNLFSEVFFIQRICMHVLLLNFESKTKNC